MDRSVPGAFPGNRPAVPGPENHCICPALDALLDKLTQLGTKMDRQIFGQECARPQVIAIGETAGDNKKVIVQ